ncbi:MAG: sugar transferase [Deltaproteobacteria bacterium]|nr:sugar transferase [Deltaproteobacteria bacterium]MBW2397789.1 sugar transferase [Deltaproteobacteria bacterium]
MLKTHWLAFQLLLVAIEIVLSATIFTIFAFSTTATGSIPTVLRHGGPSLLALGIVACSTWPLVLNALDLYSSQRRQSAGQLLLRVAAAGITSTLLIAAAAFALSAPVPAAFPFLFGATQFACLALLRLVIHGGLRLLRRGGRNYRNILIVGSGPRAADVHRMVVQHPDWALHIVGYVDDHAYAGDEGGPIGEIHQFADLPALFRDHVIDEVVVALPRSMLSTLAPVVEACSLVGVSLTIPMDLFEDFMPPPRVTRFGGSAALSYAPVHHSRFKLAIKRAIDVVGATIVLTLTAPILLVSMAAIRLTSPGAVIFRQRRCGLYGREFWMYKLRTMVNDAEEQKTALSHLNESDGPVFKIRNDPRVTRVGHFLRSWSLDELPQVWNVLMGDMSLVGPRPPVPSEVQHYRTFERRRLSMRPGITCIWQVQGRNEIGFADWVKLDVEYIETWSLSTDFWILGKTLPAVLSRTGAS